MPRKKLIRRFEPRYGVSRATLEIEAKYIAREFDDRLLLSTKELEEKSAGVRRAWAGADQVLEAAVYALATRERLALESMVVRDVYHLYELYCLHLRGIAVDAAAETTSPPPRAAPAGRASGTPERALPFSEWLFDPQA